MIGLYMITYYYVTFINIINTCNFKGINTKHPVYFQGLSLPIIFLINLYEVGALGLIVYHIFVPNQNIALGLKLR